MTSEGLCWFHTLHFFVCLALCGVHYPHGCALLSLWMCRVALSSRACSLGPDSSSSTYPVFTATAPARYNICVSLDAEHVIISAFTLVRMSHRASPASRATHASVRLQVSASTPCCFSVSSNSRSRHARTSRCTAAAHSACNLTFTCLSRIKYHFNQNMGLVRFITGKPHDYINKIANCSLNETPRRGCCSDTDSACCPPWTRGYTRRSASLTKREEEGKRRTSPERRDLDAGLLACRTVRPRKSPVDVGITVREGVKQSGWWRTVRACADLTEEALQAVFSHCIATTTRPESTVRTSVKPPR
jgi:hypothetical protein